MSTSDFSLQNARSLARDPDIDFVYLDMEHGAMRFDQLEIFLSGMTDKAGILERGNAQAHPLVEARIPRSTSGPLEELNVFCNLG